MVDSQVGPPHNGSGADREFTCLGSAGTEETKERWSRRSEVKEGQVVSVVPGSEIGRIVKVKGPD